MKEAASNLAGDYGLTAAHVLAVIAVESSGKPFERADPTLPTLLFERHKFYANLSAEKRNAAVKAGLAVPKWDKAHQYKDEGTSAGRVTVFRRAVDFGGAEVASLSCSWGLMQIMGSNHAACGFKNATEMVCAFTTVEGQLRGALEFIKHTRLLSKLQHKDWAGFARGYNGAGFKANRYDTKLADAYANYGGK